MSTRAALLFRALSDPTRLRLLQLLHGGELCVCDLMAALRIPQAKTSRHLGYLRKAGFVAARKEGLWSYYRLTRPRDPLHQKALECLQAIPLPARRGRMARCCPT